MHKLVRVRRLCWGLLILPLLVLAPPIRTAATDPIQPPPAPLPEARFLSVSTDNPFTRDRPLLATVSPNGDGYRDFVDIRFYLTPPARVVVRAQSATPSFQTIPHPHWACARSFV